MTWKGFALAITFYEMKPYIGVQKLVGAGFSLRSYRNLKVADTNLSLFTILQQTIL
jgi:hypothetical protein